MKAVSRKGDQYYGDRNGQPYLIQDDQAEKFYKRWAGLSTAALVQDVLRDHGFWEEDLHALPGFQQAVIEKLNLILEHGMKESVETVSAKKVFAA